ncbi:MAG: RNA-binding protein [Myxococcota bacterium]|nr:RNA-binding protein [Myxococcota bacterium]
MNIYVGNLPYRITEDEVRDVFGAHGEVSSVKIIIDRDTGRSKGFGFVEMPDDDAARAAIDACNEMEVSGRPLKVNEARPRPDRGPRREPRW